MTIGCQNDLAYFLTDIGRDETRVRSLIQQALRASEIPTTTDTMGFVEIVFGITQQDVETGLEKCELAEKTCEEGEKEVATAFFRLHKRRALQRLLEFD